MGLYGLWIRIRIGNPDPGPERQKLLREESEEISCFEVLDVLFGGEGAGGISCSLKAPHKGLRIKLLYFSPYIKNVEFFQL